MVRSPTTRSPGLDDGVALTLEASGEAPWPGVFFPGAQQPQLEPAWATKAQLWPR